MEAVIVTGGAPCNLITNLRTNLAACSKKNSNTQLAAITDCFLQPSLDHATFQSAVVKKKKSTRRRWTNWAAA